VSQRIPLNQNRRVTGTTEILELCKDMLRLEHGIGNDFDMDTAEFTEFRAQFLADFAQIPLIIGIDGRSGTGKTSLAAQLEQELTAAGHSVHVLHLDDFYPGWDGLEAGADIARRIAADLRGGRASSYEAWDWDKGTTGATTRVPLAPTIIEGCGAIEAEADLVIWIADPGEEERRNRALARDGQTYAPHWQRWADQDLGRPVK